MQTQARAFHSGKALLISAAAAVAFLFVGPAWGQWQPDRFTIGSYLGPDVGPAVGPTSDTTTRDRPFKVAADAYINTILSKDGAWPAYSVDPTLQAAEAANLSVFCGQFNNPSGQGTVPANLWAHFGGYHAFGCGSDECAFGRFPTDAETTGIRQIHLNSTKPAWVNFVTGDAPTVAAWTTAPSPLAQPDIISSDAYFNHPNPPSPNYYLYTMRTMRYRKNGHTFWAMGWTGGDPIATREPQDWELRFMSSAPIAYGAQGIVWWAWAHAQYAVFPPDKQVHGQYAAVEASYLPTPLYRKIRTINHYLHDMVGPAVMRSTYLAGYQGFFRQTDSLVTEQKEVLAPDEPDTERVIIKMMEAGSSPSRGAQTTAGVFRSNDEDSTYYLLFVNNRNGTITTNVQVRHPNGYYRVGAAPSVVNYAGGIVFAPVGTYSRSQSGGYYRESFDVTLQGGEGRLYKLIVEQGQFHTPFAGMTAPAGGSQWTRTGQAIPINLTYDGLTSVTGVRFYTDPHGSSAELDGPYIDLQGCSGSSGCTVSVPGDLATTRGRIEVMGVNDAGGTVRVSTPGPVRIAAAASAQQRSWNLANVTTGPAIAQLGAAVGAPTIGVYGEQEALKLWQNSGSGWSSTTVPSYSTFFHSGLAPAVLRDNSGGLRVACVMLDNPDVMYSWTPSAGTEPIDGSPGEQLGNASALVLNSQQTPYAIYNGGAAFNALRIVKRLGGFPAWTPLGQDIEVQGNPQSIHAQFDSHDTLWIACLTERGSKLHVWRMAPGSSPELIVPLQGQFWDLGLQVDGSGVVHVAYSQDGTAPRSQQLWYRRSSNWSQAEPVDGSMGAVSGLALAVGSGGPQIAYAINGVLRLASRSGGTWSFEDVDGQHDAQAPIGFSIETTGNLWFSYWDRSADSVRVIERDITPPALISDLSATCDPDNPPYGVILTWTATADDAAFAVTGPGTQFELRRSATHNFNWSSGTVVATGTCAAPGAVQVRSSSVAAATYFALKTRDAVGNWSVKGIEAGATPLGPYDECIPGGMYAGGGGGGGGYSLRQASANSLQPDRVATATGGAEFAENTLLNGVAIGSRSRDTFRLPAAIASGGTGTVRLREVGGHAAAVDAARLLVVDHASDVVAFCVDGSIVIGVDHPANQIAASDGTDLTSVLNGSGSYAITANDALVVSLGVGGGSSPVVVAASGTGALEVQVPDGQGGWQAKSQVFPRLDLDQVALAAPGSDSVRLVSRGDAIVNKVSRLQVTNSTPTTHTAMLLAAQSARLGDMASKVGAVDSASATLLGPDTLNLSYALPQASSGTREYFLVVEAAPVSVQSAAAAHLQTIEAEAPVRFALEQNRPNPVRTGATIRFALPEASPVRLEVFDAMGRHVRTLALGPHAAGWHSIDWDLSDASGNHARPGVYMYRLIAGTFSDRRKMIVLSD